MATSLAVSLTLILKAAYDARASGVELSVPTETLNQSLGDTLSEGQGLDKAQSVWSNSFAASDAGTTIDVFGGITDVFGNALSMDQIKGLLIHNTSTSTGDYVDVFGAAIGNNVAFISGETNTVRVYPDGILLMWAPGAAADCPTATAGGFDEILVTAAGGRAPTIEIVVIGENN